MLAYEKIARLLRADKKKIQRIEERLSDTTGNKYAMEKVADENASIISERLKILGLKAGSRGPRVHDALIAKMREDDRLLFYSLGEPRLDEPREVDRILQIAKEIGDCPRGLFIKKEKAIELLKKEPPQKIIDALGYKNIETLLEQEDAYEIFSALRFLEDREWLNNIFFAQYEKLTPDDFEEREIVVKSLDRKWAKAAESFVQKKYHNVSHLKELGVIFVVPVKFDIPGELIRMFVLIVHYFKEIPFYSGLFRKFLPDKDNFAVNLISLLRGTTIDKQLPNLNQKINWLIIQRYLSKEDPNDWRLSEPHINPEAIHWSRAQKSLTSSPKTLVKFSTDLRFWRDLDWVGDYFGDGAKSEILISFNFVDVIISLVLSREKESPAYLYHHREALWNKLFSEYFGEEKMEEMIRENIIKGWLEI